MITKEVLSEVLGYIPERITFNRREVIWLEGIEYKSYDINQTGTRRVSMNIYELAHKCKKWAYIQGYSIVSCYQGNGHASITNIHDDYEFEEFSGKIEPEAIFKACEWVLRQK